MDFRHVRAFIAAAEALSVTKAAERLHISQPPLTRHIQQLERELGVALFVRHRHGVTLTEAGRQLLEKARAWDAAASDFCETAKRVVRPEPDQIRIGIGWGLWDIVNEARVAFAKECPGVALEAVDTPCWYDSDPLLRDRAVDVVFARPPFSPDFHVSQPLFHERIQAIVSGDSPYVKAAAVNLRELAGERLLLWERHVAPALYDRIFELYSRADISPVTVPTPGAGPYNHAGLMLVAAGKGIYLGYGIPLTHPRPAGGVAVVPLRDEGATIEVCLVSRKGDVRPVVERFIECVAGLHSHETAAELRVRTRALRRA